MTDKRLAIFTVPTPLPYLPEVTLFADTWQKHIVPHKPYMAGKEDIVQATIASPSVIVSGTSNPDYLVFVNQDVTSSAGNPLVVMVDPRAGIICTALHHRSFKIIQPGQKLWSP